MVDFKDLNPLAYFQDLHLFPRTIFLTGLVILIGSFPFKALDLGALGLILIFAAVTLNLFLNSTWSINGESHVAWVVLAQAVLALALTIVVTCLSYYHYRHGQMPPFLRPIPLPRPVN
jgi:hypothetical protein